MANTHLIKTSLTQLPNIADAVFPATYERAKSALATCSEIDECKDWANKAEALASYAKQSGDHSLRKMADRIQARAIRRCGELLKQIQPSKGGRPKTGSGAPTSFREKAAKAAGLSKDQRVTAMRVERVPSETFESLVESEYPPTVTALADIGRVRHARVAEASKRPGFAAATSAIGSLRRLAEFCSAHDPIVVAQGVTPPHVKTLRRDVAIIDKWIDTFITHVEDK